MRLNKIRRFLISISVVLLLSSISNGEILSCKNVFTSRQDLQVEIVNDSAQANLSKFEQIFTRSRGLQSYTKALGEPFAKKIEELNTLEHHWIDSGAGDGVAVWEFLNNLNSKSLTSIVSLETNLTSTDRLNVFKGRFLEEIPNSEFKKADLITDVFGPLAYSGQPDLILKKYLNILKDNGEIHVFLGVRNEIYGKSNMVITADGKYLNFADWIVQIPGLKVKLFIEQRDDEGVIVEKWNMIITKNPQTILNVPKLELVNLQDGAPPKMLFREVSTSKQDISTTIQNFSSEIRKKIKTSMTKASFTDFINSFRSGEFTHPLLKSIKKLTENDSWLNVSYFGDTLIENFKRENFNSSDTSIFVKLAQSWIKWRIGRVDTHRLKYTHIEGIDSLDPNNSFKLITDFNGEFLTSLKPDEVLQRYMDLLHSEGELYIYLGPDYTGFGYNSEVITSTGDRMSLRKWIQSIPDLKVNFYRGGYHWAGGQWTFVRIRKKAQNPRIPNLTFKGLSPLQTSEEVISIFEAK